MFEGIGGFALAADWTWPGIEHVFCEIEPFCQAVLKKNFPNAPIYGDIRKFSAATYADEQRYVYWPAKEQSAEGALEAQRQSLASSRSSPLPEIHLLTGGFPCQPFSQAGKRLGTEDDRHLWPEMLRVIREFHPRWVIGENVGGFVTWSGGLVLEQVHADLETEGYEVQAFVIPACAVNAPHRRDRVWIVAHSKSGRGGEKHGHVSREAKRPSEQFPKSGRAACDAAHAIDERQQKSGQTGQRKLSAQASEGLDNRSQQQNRNAPYASNARLQRSISQQSEGYCRQSHRDGSDERPSWSKDWTEVAAKLCTLDDGLSRGLVRPRGWRNAALKAAGNAIVPQVAAEIMRAIATTESAR